MAEEWTDEEREFLHTFQGGLFAILGGQGGAIGQANQSAVEAVRVLKERYPNRMHRLLIFQAIGTEMKRARDEVLKELLLANVQWVQREDGTWATVALHDYEIRHMAELAGVTTQTIRALYRKVLKESHDALEERESEVVKGHG